MPPLIIRTDRILRLFTKFTTAVKRFAGTQPLFRSILSDRTTNQNFSQVALAYHYLRPEATEKARNAVDDVNILTELISIIELTN